MSDQHPHGDMMTKEPDWRDSIEACIAFSSRDWSRNHRDAWIYGVIMGWSPEALAEQKQKHNWSDSTVTLLGKLRELYLKEAVTDHPIAPPPRLADAALDALGGRLDPGDFRIIDQTRHEAIHNALARLKQLEAYGD